MHLNTKLAVYSLGGSSRISLSLEKTTLMKAENIATKKKTFKYKTNKKPSNSARV